VFNWTKIALMVLAVLAVASPAMAQDGGTSVLSGAAIGAGFIILGAGFGIGRIGSSAVESMG
jgi:F-type H+-transporting ATPase subunit c